MSKRKTKDCWRLYVNYGYGDGWELEITEYSRKAIQANFKAYLENCSYPVKIVKGRERIGN